MYNINKKQKIILGVLIAIIIGFIYYYVYAKEDNTTQLENILETQNEEIEQKENSGDIIFVHVSGAVNQEGVVELKADSRIADAIDKARRSKRRCLYKRY